MVGTRGRSLAVIFTGAAVLAGCASSTKAVPSAPVTTFYLRPVMCQIPAYSGSTSSSSVTSTLPSGLCHETSAASIPSTSDDPTAAVILPTDPRLFSGAAGFRYVLGPPDMTVTAISNAQVLEDQVTGQYSVQLTLTSEGAAELDRIAEARYRCDLLSPAVPPPRSQEAFDIDGLVESAPTFQASSFHGNVSITGDFDRTEATAMAAELELAAHHAH